MIGSQTARLAVAAGINVILANTRGPEPLRDLVQDLGTLARAATVDEAVAAAELVVAIPFAAYKRLSPDQLAGKIIVDTINYYPERDGEMAEVRTDRVSTSDLVQKHLAKSHVIRAINNMDFVRLLRLARPVGSAERSAVPIAGDNAAAKADVAAFLHAVGYDIVDMGPLSESWEVSRRRPSTSCRISVTSRRALQVTTRRWSST